MKYITVLCALLVAVSAHPVDVASGNDSDVVNVVENDVNRNAKGIIDDEVGNSTSRFDTYGLAGFGFRTIGGVNGAVWNVFDPWALRDAVSGNSPRIVYVRGRIDLTQLFTGSPGVRVHVGSYKSIIGVDRTAEIYGGGLALSGVQHVIIDNIKFTNVLSYAPGEQPDGNGFIQSQQPGAYSTIDGIGIISSENVWVNHCEFSDDPWNSAATSDDRRRHHGQINLSEGANWVSISNNIFRNHNLVTLVGSADHLQGVDGGKLKTTFYSNWYQGVTQRNPLVRFGEVHVLNNLYTDVSGYGIGVWVGANIYAERNSFINTRRSWGYATTGPPNPPGFLLNYNNLLSNSGFDSGIYGSGVNWNPSQYYAYTPMAASSVEAHVRTYAGIR